MYQASEKSLLAGRALLWFTKRQYFHIFSDLCTYRTGEREEPIHFISVQHTIKRYVAANFTSCLEKWRRWTGDWIGQQRAPASGAWSCDGSTCPVIKISEDGLVRPHNTITLIRGWLQNDQLDHRAISNMPNKPPASISTASCTSKLVKAIRGSWSVQEARANPEASFWKVSCPTGCMVASCLFRVH